MKKNILILTILITLLSCSKNNKLDLFRAIEKNEISKVKELIENGIDINVKDMINRTPLTAAVEFNRFDILKYLIKKGAKVKISDGHRTPLTIAAQNNNIKIMKLLIENGADIADVNMYFVIGGSQENYKAVRYLIENGYGINKRNKYGFTPIMTTCIWGHKKIVKYLLSKRVKLNIRTKTDFYARPGQKIPKGYTALKIAKLFKHKGIVKMIQKSGLN